MISAICEKIKFFFNNLTIIKNFRLRQLLKELDKLNKEIDNNNRLIKKYQNSIKKLNKYILTLINILDNLKLPNV